VDFFRVRWGVFAVFMLNCFPSALHSSMSSNMGPLTELSLCKISDLLLLTKVLDFTGLIAYSCRPNILKISLSLPTIYIFVNFVNRNYFYLGRFAHLPVSSFGDIRFRLPAKNSDFGTDQGFYSFSKCLTGLAIKLCGAFFQRSQDVYVPLGGARTSPTEQALKLGFSGRGPRTVCFGSTFLHFNWGPFGSLRAWGFCVFSSVLNTN
jgi:hypothetical protein